MFHFPQCLASMLLPFAQNTIEGRLEKRSKGVFAPVGGKRMIAFIDDLNMPMKSPFGFIPPLELLKLWIDNGFWYDRTKCESKEIRDMQMLTAMAPPGGGRNPFSQRVMSCFSMICITSPTSQQLHKIYSTLLSAHLADFDETIRPLSDQIAQASVGIYQSVVQNLLPTPAKAHYLFNTRDLAKIIQGVMQSTKAFYDSKDSLLALWCHESCRVIQDRMWDAADKHWVQQQLDERLSSMFATSWSEVFQPYAGDCPPFARFLRQVEDPPFEPVTDMSNLKTFLLEKLDDYALEPGNSAMSLVLFRDAILHLCRISRILKQPRGNALLMGVGASHLQVCSADQVVQLQ
jgi:dynein heavy chain, axonemal